MNIELTDEQFREIENIFDVQGIRIPENLIKATANIAFELLTEEQIKHLAESKGMCCTDNKDKQMNIEMLEKIAKKIPVASKAGIRPSVPELMPFLIEFLKEYEQSKWVEFDYKDQSTWPEHGDSVLVLIDKRFLEVIGAEEKAYFADFMTKDFYCDFEVYYCDEANGYFAITHWQPLPEILKSSEEKGL
jgi:hypothetical protein